MRDHRSRFRDSKRDGAGAQTRSAGRADAVRETAIVDRHVNQHGRRPVPPSAPRTNRADWPEGLTFDHPPAIREDSAMQV
jgi:hypothetical protein